MLKLRSNQEEPIRIAIEYFKEKKPKPSLIVLPTAWGKSILTACVAKETNDKLLIVQPSKELLEQNYNKYVTLCGGNNASIYSASCNSKQISQITYATIGSIKNIGKEFKELGFTKMLIDEAHLYPREADSMLGTFLSDSEITHVLGITATPIKLQQGYDRDGNTISKLVMLTSRSKLGNSWKMYSGEILLSGIPIHEIGNAPIECLPFGKYQGVLLKDVPRDYLKWCIDNMKLAPDVKDAILRALSSPPLIDVIKHITSVKQENNIVPCYAKDTEILLATGMSNERFKQEINKLIEASLITEYNGVNNKMYGTQES
jgi:DNA repair protein RadD